MKLSAQAKKVVIDLAVSGVFLLVVAGLAAYSVSPQARGFYIGTYWWIVLFSVVGYGFLGCRLRQHKVDLFNHEGEKVKISQDVSQRHLTIFVKFWFLLLVVAGLLALQLPAGFQSVSLFLVGCFFISSLVIFGVVSFFIRRGARKNESGK